MSLDETSLAIGRLQAAQESTTHAVTEVKSDVAEVNAKLDKLLTQSLKHRLSMKNWITIIGAASAGGGGVAHALSRIFGS